MEEISAGQFSIISSLVDQMDEHLAIRALIEGEVKGKVFVNDMARPSFGYAMVRSRHFLFGGPQRDEDVDDISGTLKSRIIPSIPTGREWFTLFHDHEWEGQLDRIFGDIIRMKGIRRYYEMKNDHQIIAAIPDGFEIVDVEKAADMASLQNHDGLLDEMASERVDVADFRKKSFGTALVHGNVLVGWCMSEYNFEDRCEIGIEIVPEYRRKGFGVALAMSFLDLARGRGIKRVGWHCRAENVPSNATAVKIGMKHVLDYPACYGRIIQ